MPDAPPATAVEARVPGEFSTLRKALICVGLLIGLLGIPFMFWLTIQYRPRESTPLADINWLPTGEKRSVHALVADEKGAPLSGIRIEFEGPAGAATGVTAGDGTLDLTLPGDVFHTIRLNGQTVMQRAHAEWLRFPSAEAGVKLRVVVKDVQALRGR